MITNSIQHFWFSDFRYRHLKTCIWHTPFYIATSLYLIFCSTEQISWNLLVNTIRTWTDFNLNINFKYFTDFGAAKKLKQTSEPIKYCGGEGTDTTTDEKHCVVLDIFKLLREVFNMEYSEYPDFKSFDEKEKYEFIEEVSVILYFIWTSTYFNLTYFYF